MTIKRCARHMIAAACLILCNQTASADELLGKAREHLEARQPAQAYSLLAAQQSRRAGDPDFDYLLAIAALDSGKPTEAVFALERVLSANPGNGPARLELARAYFMLGETTASRLEFETVKMQQPPDQVNRVIQEYLGSINQLAGAQASALRGFVETFIGYDSNVNVATSAGQVAIPFLGGTLVGELDADFRRKSDPFFGVAGGISGRHALSADLALNGYLNINQRYHSHERDFDLGYVDSAIGVTKTHGVDQYSAALQYQKTWLDRDSYRTTVGAIGQWQHVIDDQRQTTAYVQLARLDYDGVQRARNANRYVVGGAYSQAFDGEYAPVVFGGAYVGRENATRGNVAHLDNNLAGLRIGGQLMLSTDLKLTGNLSVERRHYGADEPLFGEKRRDTQTDFGVGLSYTPALLWTIRPEILVTRNSSNIVLNDYTRRQFLITLRRDFE